ncbi:hypothetical protein PY247_11425 [Acinetobacter proteolyticus]|nr:hypothetical protein [Acinetobacter proteolyticus]WEI17165.1 hypothetical protein PY247_11425 [Acinetobacter proteolyticus]
MSASKNTISRFLTKEFNLSYQKYLIGEISKHGATITCEYEEDVHFSQQQLFIAADFAMQAAILGKLGKTKSLTAKSMNLHFFYQLSKTSEIIGEGRLIESNQTYFLAEVLMYTSGVKKPVAQIMGTYTAAAKYE